MCQSVAMTKLTLTLLIFVLCQLLSLIAADITNCYSGTSYWTGLKTGTKDECGEETSYCYIIWGKTVHGSSTRGCAPGYIHRLCEDLKPNYPKGHVSLMNCFTVDTSYVKGRLCCCDQNLCNLGSKNAPLASTFVVTLILYYFVRGALL
uniref:Activin_recp domain-containing protein n=1 Tax=Panagrellus redivivus TaxID=6233 RepID=A0A7E4W399_PANRE